MIGAICQLSLQATKRSIVVGFELAALGGPASTFSVNLQQFLTAQNALLALTLMLFQFAHVIRKPPVSSTYHCLYRMYAGLNTQLPFEPCSWGPDKFLYSSLESPGIELLGIGKTHCTSHFRIIPVYFSYDQVPSAFHVSSIGLRVSAGNKVNLAEDGSNSGLNDCIPCHGTSSILSVPQAAWIRDACAWAVLSRH